MKASDLEKHIDNLIIDGLIKEAEQDNADFEAAMKNMSDEDFLALIYDAVPDEPVAADADVHFSRSCVAFEEENSFCAASPCPSVDDYAEPILCESATDLFDDDVPEEKSMQKSSGRRLGSGLKRKGWLPWVAAVASAAAILLIVLIPAYSRLDSRLCESALLASVEISRGNDIPSMPKEEVESMLPELEKQYSASRKPQGELQQGAVPDDSGLGYYTERIDSNQAALDLVQAYLRLNKKAKAVEVLKEISESDASPEFRQYCNKLLEILE